MNESLGELFVTHRDPALVADGRDELAVACIDPQRNLQLNLVQTTDVGQCGPQVGVGTHIGERRQHDRSGQNHTNARDEN